MAVVVSSFVRFTLIARFPREHFDSRLENRPCQNHPKLRLISERSMLALPARVAMEGNRPSTSDIDSDVSIVWSKILK